MSDLRKEILRLAPNRTGSIKSPCPSCGPTRKNKHDKSLSITRLNASQVVWNCHNVGCDFRGGHDDNFATEGKRVRPHKRDISNDIEKNKQLSRLRNFRE